MTVTIANKLGQIILGKGGFRLESAQGLTAADYSPHIINYGTIDGGRFHSSKIPPRKLKFVFKLFGTDSENTRESLIGFFSPKVPHNISVNRNGITRNIIGYVSLFDTVCESVNRPVTATVEFICPDPFFRDDTPVHSTYSRLSPLIAFPMIFKPGGIAAGYSIPGNELTVINAGHDETGFVIEITCAEGSAEDIRISNEANGHFILFNGTLNEGDKLKISTENGNKFVTLNGENAISFVNRQSSFFPLETGENKITCVCSSGRKCLDMSLSFTPRFLGV